MYPSWPQILYVACLMAQLRVELATAAILANLRSSPTSLSELTTLETMALVDALERERLKRGFPSLTLQS